MARIFRLGAFASAAAALSMSAAPAIAADLPANVAHSAYAQGKLFNSASENASDYRPYRYRRHRDRVDAGDVLAGVLIIGGIAAIASAASKNKRERDYRDYPDRDARYDYRSRNYDPRSSVGQGLDRAVDMCVSRIERDARVDSVDTVDRDGNGWRVSGQLYNGDAFTCSIGPDGRIGDVDYGRGYRDSAQSGADYDEAIGYEASGEDNQYDDDRYAQAWARVDAGQTQRPAQPTVSSNDGASYPGGPVAGEESYPDDRYEMAQ